MRHAITGGYIRANVFFLSPRAYLFLRPSGISISFGVPAESDEKRAGPSIDSLDAYALERWEVCMARDGLAPNSQFLDGSALHGFIRDWPDAR